MSEERKEAEDFNSPEEYLDHLRTFRTPETYFKRTIRPNPAKAQLAKLVSNLNA